MEEKILVSKNVLNSIEKIGIELEKSNEIQEKILDELKKQNKMKKEHFAKKVKWGRDIR